MNLPNVDKMEIRAFQDKKYNKKAKNPVFVIPINPENYSQNLKVEYDLAKGQGNQGTDPKFKGTAPEDLKLEFLFDGTGTVMGNILKDTPVAKQVKDFLGVVYDMEGEIHKPHFLKIIWGEFLRFDCILTSLDINYTMFSPKGEPLRAKLNASFTNYIEQEKRVRREDKKSPDLTHIETVEAGDKLTLMTHNIYGDGDLYMKVAKANNLTSFRQLTPGMGIIFPTLDKELNE